METIEKGFKYRIYPKKSQIEQIELMFNAKRFIWNHFLKLNMDKFQKKEKLLTYNQMSSLLTQLKKENIWLKQCEKSILQNTLKDLARAYSTFFKGSMKYTKETIEHAKRVDKKLTFYDLEKHPKFKSYKNNYQSCKMNFTNNNIEVLEKETKYTSTGKYRKQFCKIKLPKIKKVRIAYSRQYQGRIVSSTLSRDTDNKYYISLCCVDIVNNPYKQTGVMVGVDLGVKEFATTSDNEVINNPKFYRKYEKQLIKTQKVLSRRKIKGNNRNKQRLKVNKYHKKIANCRIDFLQKLSTELVKNYDIICMEDLNTKGMLKNHKLAKSIADVSFYEFNRELEYKSKWNYKVISRIDRFYPSSQICSGCGNQSNQTKDLSVRTYICEKCGLEIDRDYNASLNILNEGLRLLEDKVS